LTLIGLKWFTIEDRKHHYSTESELFSLFLESFSEQKLGTEQAMLMLYISNISSWMHYH